MPSANATREEYLNTILDTIDNFKAKTSKMSIFLILALDRGNTTATEAMEIIDLAITNKTRGIVGVDLCGNPTNGDVSLYGAAFARAKAHGLGLTLHFAETPTSGAPSELATLLSFQPDRLGHVIHVPDEVKQEIARRKLGLELCMSCNVHAKLIAGGFLDHHFGYWRHTACPIALCVSYSCSCSCSCSGILVCCVWDVLTHVCSRLMTWAFSVALSRMSIALLRSLLGWDGLRCWAFVEMR